MSNKTAWTIIGSSVRGNGHIKNNLPCQDSHAYTMIKNNWGLIVISDGAGSYKYPEKGSSFITERSLFLFGDLIAQYKWASENKLPSVNKWHSLSRETLIKLSNDLKQYAFDNDLEYKHLGSTVVIVIFSPKGLLVCHVGDGRAGYLNERGHWKAAMEPFQGEEASSTVFITLEEIWRKPNIYIESRVILNRIKAFCLLSDGCERVSWVSTKRRKNGIYQRENKPFSKFFNQNLKTLKKLSKQNGVRLTNEKWAEYLQKGHSGFVDEQDDKTMVIGFL